MNDKYEYDWKCIYFESEIFFEKGNVIQTIVKDSWLEGKGPKKPDIVYVSECEIIIIDRNICLETRMQINYNEKTTKYASLMLRLRRIFKIKRARVIPVIFNIYGIIYEQSKKDLNKVQIKLDYNKMSREILCK